MAKSAPKTTVSITAGQNDRVNNVLKFEDLVQHAKQGAAKSRSRAAAPAKQREQLAAVKRLAGELETVLRQVRASAPDEPGPARTRRTRARKRKA